MARICFISDTDQVDRPLNDPSTRYRCYHLGEALQQLGHQVHVTALAHFLENPLLGQDLYVFHRPRPDPGELDIAPLARLLDELRLQGAQLAADYDDLVFGDHSIARQSSMVRGRGKSVARATERFQANLQVLRLFDRVTVSSDPLAEQVRHWHPQAEVQTIPNAVPASLLQKAQEAELFLCPRAKNSIGYFSGTATHDRDFRLVEPALRTFLRQNWDASLLLVGAVTPSCRLRRHPRVTRHEPVAFESLGALMSRCATVIAPLETTPFNRCKSRGKFLEAALAGCRLVATPVPELEAAGSGWIRFADSADEWLTAFQDRTFQADWRRWAQQQFESLEQNQSAQAAARCFVAFHDVAEATILNEAAP